MFKNLLSFIATFYKKKNGKPAPVKTGIVTQQIQFGRCVADLLESQGHLVMFSFTTTIDIKEQLVADDLPRVILIDLLLLKDDGFDIISFVRKHYPSIKILVMGLDDDEKPIIHLFKKGINGYISKTFEPWRLNIALAVLDSEGNYYEGEDVDRLIRY